MSRDIQAADPDEHPSLSSALSSLDSNLWFDGVGVDTGYQVHKEEWVFQSVDFNKQISQFIWCVIETKRIETPKEHSPKFWGVVLGSGM